MSTFEIKQKVDNLYRQAYRLRADGQWVEAVKVFGQIINIIPDYAFVYVERGLLLREMLKIDAAKQDFDRAIQLDPKCGLAYYGRGWVRDAFGDYAGELADAQYGLSLDMENAGMYYRRIGSALAGLKRYQEAVEAYNHAVELNGNQDTGTIYNRGKCYAEMRNYDLALADFNRCLELSPHWAWAFTERGQIYLLYERLDLAIADFTEAIKHDANYITAYLRRAVAYQKKGDNKRAKEEYELLLKMNITPAFRAQVQGYLQKLR